MQKYWHQLCIYFNTRNQLFPGGVFMNNLNNKVIITAALTGALTPKGYKIPETPDEIAESAYQCWKEGAAVVHIHTRAKDGLGAMVTEDFLEIVKKIRAYPDCDVIINCTSSGSTPAHMCPDEMRYRHHELCPEIEMGSVDSGSMNFTPIAVFENSPQFLENILKAYNKHDVKPEFEIFDAGMISNVNYYYKQGLIQKPMHFQFCMGVTGGVPATVEHLAFLSHQLPEGSTWSAFGIGSGHMPILYAAIALGGHVRVGLEDNVIYGFDENGEKIIATNEMLVKRAAEAIRLFGKQPATSAEAREILSLKPLVR